VRYAIPVSGGIVATHFGHCESFVLIDVDTQKKEITKKEIVSSPGHEPGLLPAWLAGEGVSVVIAGGMGSRAQDIFRQNNITVIIGTTESDPEKAVMSYLNGTLSAGDNICDH